MSLAIGIIVGFLLGALSYALWLKNHDHDPDAPPGWWTVVGVWKQSKERYALHVQAADARQAEDLAQHVAQEKVADLWVTGVFPGKLENADDYATFVDPDVKRADWLNADG